MIKYCCFLYLVKPEYITLLVNDSVVCKSDVISITCSADGKPAVHTYQLFENEIPVNDGNSSAGVCIRQDLKEGDFLGTDVWLITVLEQLRRL